MNSILFEVCHVGVSSYFSWLCRLLHIFYNIKVSSRFRGITVDITLLSVLRRKNEIPSSVT